MQRMHVCSSLHVWAQGCWELFPSKNKNLKQNLLFKHFWGANVLCVPNGTECMRYGKARTALGLCDIYNRMDNPLTFKPEFLNFPNSLRSHANGCYQ